MFFYVKKYEKNQEMIKLRLKNYRGDRDNIAIIRLAFEDEFLLLK